MAIKTLTTEIKDAVKYPTLPPAGNSLDLVFTAPTVAADGIDFAGTGREVAIVLNSDPTNPYTFTLKSVADSLNRTGDVGAYSLAAGEYAVLIPPVAGFAQSNGRILITMENVAVKVAVIRLPGQI